VNRNRAAELGLILLAAVVTTGTYGLAGLGGSGPGEGASIPADIGPFLVGVLVLLLVAHLAVRRWAADADGTLLPLAALLNGIGYAFIVRLDGDLAKFQAGWTLIGISAFVLTIWFVRDIRVLARYRWIFALVGMIALVAPIAPVIGREINGARLWVSLGPFNLQPGEFAKIALVVFVASYLAEKRELLALGSKRLGPMLVPDLKHLGPVLAAWGASLLVMIFERDLGSSLLVFTTFVAMVWIATGRGWYLGVGVGLFAFGATLAWWRFEHVQARVRSWIDPWQDVSGDGFQITQSWFALASGGLTGTGPGLGSPKRIPASETDFIFAVIGEELGLIGATAIITAFILLIGSGLRIAVRTRDEFAKLLATGLTITLGIQAFIIMGGILRVLPLTGITLPFVSYGGSSLVANYILLALLLRVSHDSAQVSEQDPVAESVIR